VRGMGLLQAIELVEDRDTKKPASALMPALMEATRENKILVGKGGFFGNVLRISPPLNRNPHWPWRRGLRIWTSARFTKSRRPPSRPR
jgi:4-aminobutyrate aminotransferase-like enzyme